MMSGDIVDNDTKLLYDFLRKTGGICISHTSATDMGTGFATMLAYICGAISMMT